MTPPAAIAIVTARRREMACQMPRCRSAIRPPTLGGPQRPCAPAAAEPQDRRSEYHDRDGAEDRLTREHPERGQDIAGDDEARPPGFGDPAPKDPPDERHHERRLVAPGVRARGDPDQ